MTASTWATGDPDDDDLMPRDAADNGGSDPRRSARDRLYGWLCLRGVHGTRRARSGYFCPGCARLAWRRNA